VTGRELDAEGTKFVSVKAKMKMSVIPHRLFNACFIRLHASQAMNNW
jgi:hypothetical protein